MYNFKFSFRTKITFQAFSIRNVDIGSIKSCPNLLADEILTSIAVVYMCFIFTACSVFLLNLDDVMRAFEKKEG